jgi:hypothetical protein
MIVEQKRWLTAAEFTDMLGLCQFLPGGNIMNLTIALGARFHGAPGAVTAFAGLMAAPFATVILLGLVHDRYGDLPAVQHTFHGLAAAASALVLANALRIAAPLRTRPAGIAVAVATFHCDRRAAAAVATRAACHDGDFDPAGVAFRERVPCRPWSVSRWCSCSYRCWRSVAPIRCCRRCSVRWCRCIHG